MGQSCNDLHYDRQQVSYCKVGSVHRVTKITSDCLVRLTAREIAIADFARRLQVGIRGCSFAGARSRQQWPPISPWATSYRLLAPGAYRFVADAIAAGSGFKSGTAPDP